MSLPPLNELVNVLEVEDVARNSVLSRAVYDRIAQGERGREAFDRITFRPRMMVDVSGLDLSLHLFGQTLYAPILVAPMARHRRAHPDGEAAREPPAASARGCENC